MQLLEMMRSVVAAGLLLAVSGDLTSGSCTNSPSDACSESGSSASYSESIDGDTRSIQSSGCPANNPLTNCLGDNPSKAAEQGWRFDIPATPQFVRGGYEASLAAATSLSAIGGLVGMTRNGVEIRSCYGGHAYAACAF